MNRPSGLPRRQFWRDVQFWIDNAHALLVLSTYLLLLLSRVIDTALLGRDSEYLSIVLLQVMIFLIPALFSASCAAAPLPSACACDCLAPRIFCC